VFWQHSEKCDVCKNAVVSRGMQYFVMEIMAVCVTFTVVHEVTLSLADWQICIFGGESCVRERPHGRSKRRRAGNIKVDL
jgi:hypothetical protein